MPETAEVEAPVKPKSTKTSTRKHPDKTKTTTDRPVPKTIPFFDRIQQISKADWGARAKIKLYRLEPLIDKLRGSEYKVVSLYEEPIDEQRIKLEHGSGRYRLYLNFKMPGANEGKELDTVEFDILDPSYPPRVPYGEWVDDFRNKKWAWAKPPDPNAQKQQETQAHSTMTEAVRVVNEIQDSTLERMKSSIPPPAPAAPQTDPFNAFLKGMEMQQKNAPQQVSPSTENAVLNTVVTLFTKQVDAQAEQIRELRQELREQLKKPDSNGLGTVTQVLDGLGQLLPKVKETFPGLTEHVGRGSRMGPWMEFFQPAITERAGAIKPLSQLLIMRLAQPNATLMQNPGQPQQPGQLPAGQVNPTNGQPPMVQFMNVITPAMLRHLNEWVKDPTNDDFGGKGFAATVDDMFGERWPNSEGIDWLTEAKTAGADNIVLVYQGVPALWTKLAAVEKQFRQFVQDFVAWERPSEAEEPTDEVVDLTQQPAIM